MKAVKFNFKEIDQRQPSLILKLAPTSEDGTSGEAIIEFEGLLEPKEITGTTKDGKSFKTTRYEMLFKPIEGAFLDVINKQEVPKKDPKTGRVIGKELLPKVYNADELNDLMKQRGNEYAILRLSQGNYEFIRKNMNAGKVNKGDIIKLAYTIGANGSVTVRKIFRAEVSEDPDIDNESDQ